MNGCCLWKVLIAFLIFEKVYRPLKRKYLVLMIGTYGWAEKYILKDRYQNVPIFQNVPISKNVPMHVDGTF